MPFAPGMIRDCCCTEPCPSVSPDPVRRFLPRSGLQCPFGLPDLLQTGLAVPQFFGSSSPPFVLAMVDMVRHLFAQVAFSQSLDLHRSVVSQKGLRPGKTVDTWYATGIPPATPKQTELLLLCGTQSAGSRRGLPLRQSRNNLNTRPKRRDRLLDHESVVRQVRHNPLYDHEQGEAEDRIPPGVGYHYVILAWQSFIPGNIEKELHKTLEQRPAKVVDVLSSADAVAVLRPEEDVAKLLRIGSAELNQAA